MLNSLFRSTERGDAATATVIGVAAFALITSLIYQRVTTPTHTAESDKIDATRGQHKEAYTSTEAILACSDYCYSLPATLHHQFADGNEHTAVERVFFPRGEYLVF